MCLEVHECTVGQVRKNKEPTELTQEKRARLKGAPPEPRLPQGHSLCPWAWPCCHGRKTIWKQELLKRLSSDSPFMKVPKPQEKDK